MDRRTVIATVAIAAACFGLWWFLGRDKPNAQTTDEDDPPSLDQQPESDETGQPRRVPPRPGPFTRAAEHDGATGTRDPAGRAEPAPAVAPRSGSPTGDQRACDDGDPCTFRDRIRDGVCSGQPLHCDDENPLTVDSCTGDGCAHAFVPGAFDGLNDRRTSL